MKKYKAIIFLIITTFYLAGCINNSENNNINMNLDGDWKSNTIKKIQSSKKDGLYYDYILNNGKADDPNSTIIYAEIFTLLGEDIPLDTMRYLRMDITAGDYINTLRKAYLINEPETLDTKDIKKIIENEDTNTLQKISDLFFIFKYASYSKEEVELLEKFLIENKSLYLDRENFELGNLYEFGFLTNIIDLELPTYLEDYLKDSKEDIEYNLVNNIEELDIFDLFYFTGINNEFTSKFNSNQLQKIEDYLTIYIDSNDPTLFDLFVIANIYKDLNLSPELQKLLFKSLESFKDSEIKEGAVTINKTATPNLEADALARINLKLLNVDSISEENTKGHLLLGNSENLRLKLLAYKHFEENNIYMDDLIIDIENFNNKLLNEKMSDIPYYSKILENIFYITDFYITNDLEFNNEILEYYEKILEKYYEKFDVLGSTEQRYIIDSMLNIGLDLDRQEIINKVSNYYSNEKSIFIRDNRSDILVNYDYSYILNKVEFEEINYHEILSKFINSEGGFNFNINDNETSSLVSTFFGLLYFMN